MSISIKIGTSIVSVPNPRVWHPTDLASSLVECWDAQVPSSMDMDVDGNVSAWRGLKLGTSPAPTSDIRRPVWSATSFGGDAGLSFNGEQSLTLASHPFATGATPGEIWAVVQQDAGLGDSEQRNIFNYGGTKSRRLARAYNGANRFRGAANGGGDYVSVTGSSVNFTGRHYVRVIYTATNISIEVDGISEGSSAVVPTTTTGPLRIGSLESSNSNFFLGQISFIGVTGILSAGEEASMREFCS